MTTTNLPFSMSGNMTDDPELRFTPSGAAVANFTVAFNHRRLDKASGEWVDGETTFMRCTAWRNLAEHCAESLRKGARVMVSGELFTETWEDKNDQRKRSEIRLRVDDVGPSLVFATAKVTKQQRSYGGVPTDPVTGEAATETVRPTTSAPVTDDAGDDDEPPF